MKTRYWKQWAKAMLLRTCLLLASGMLWQAGPIKESASVQSAIGAGDRGEWGDFDLFYPPEAVWNPNVNWSGTPNNGWGDGDNPCSGSLDYEGGRVIDVTKLGVHSAVPDDGNDDTQAFITAYDCVVWKYRAVLRNPKYRWSREYVSNIIYVPEGIYEVSRPILFTGGQMLRENGQGAEHAIRFVGQNREHTIIRLTSDPEGYFNNKDEPTPLISYAHPDTQVNNEVATNVLRNLTIDTGNYAGAVGVRFGGANTAEISNVTVMGNGVCGIWFSIGATQGYYRDITVEGFDKGIVVDEQVTGLPTHPNFEYVTLRNQGDAGFVIDNTSASIRRLLIENTDSSVKSLQLDENSYVVVIDSELNSGSPAIVQNSGNFMARNVSTPGGYIDEEVSYPGWPKALFQTQARNSLNLPIEDAPGIPYLDPNQYPDLAMPYPDLTDPSEYRVVHPNDDIQAILNSGVSTLYFVPYPGRFEITKNYTIPRTVTRINFLFSVVAHHSDFGKNETAAFVVDTGDENSLPLVIEDGFTPNYTSDSQGFRDAEVRYEGSKMVWFQHASKRTLVLRHSMNMRNVVYQGASGAGKVFLENVSGGPNTLGPIFQFCEGQKIWARHINPEDMSPAILNQSAKTWIMGYKVEGHGVTDMQNQKGGFLEVLGGFHNELTQGTGSMSVPVFINDNSYASLTFRETLRAPAEYLVRETRDEQTRNLTRNQVPKLDGEALVPLYVGYTELPF